MLLEMGKGHDRWQPLLIPLPLQQPVQVHVGRKVCAQKCEPKCAEGRAFKRGWHVGEVQEEGTEYSARQPQDANMPLLFCED